jgi:cytochrome c peroxidase
MARGITLALLLAAACGGRPADPALTAILPAPFSSASAPEESQTALAPLPEHIELDQRKVALGKRLWTDPRLSGDGAVSCSTCHMFTRGGANAEAHSQLRNRPPVALNVPSVFNLAFDFRFGWSGRYEDIGEILDTAMQSKSVMASSWSKAAERLARDSDCSAAFDAIYASRPTAGSIREVLALYSLSLLTPNARFDRYLRGETKLTLEEQHGYELFREYGCISCHQGINIGGNLLQRFGVVHDYLSERGNLTPADEGLFAATQRPEDRFVFRVPSLRNVALTAPYFHDGSAATLEEAISIMASYQLGRSLDGEQTKHIASFLRSLTGELDGVPL